MSIKSDDFTLFIGRQQTLTLPVSRSQSRCRWRDSACSLTSVESESHTPHGTPQRIATLGGTPPRIESHTLGATSCFEKKRSSVRPVFGGGDGSHATSVSLTTAAGRDARRGDNAYSKGAAVTGYPRRPVLAALSPCPSLRQWATTRCRINTYPLTIVASGADVVRARARRGLLFPTEGLRRQLCCRCVTWSATLFTSFASKPACASRK